MFGYNLKIDSLSLLTQPISCILDDKSICAVNLNCSTLLLIGRMLCIIVPTLLHTYQLRNNSNFQRVFGKNDQLKNGNGIVPINLVQSIVNV